MKLNDIKQEEFKASIQLFKHFLQLTNFLQIHIQHTYGEPLHLGQV